MEVGRPGGVARVADVADDGARRRPSRRPRSRSPTGGCRSTCCRRRRGRTTTGRPGCCRGARPCRRPAPRWACRSRPSCRSPGGRARRDRESPHESTNETGPATGQTIPPLRSTSTSGTGSGSGSGGGGGGGAVVVVVGGEAAARSSWWWAAAVVVVVDSGTPDVAPSRRSATSPAWRRRPPGSPPSVSPAVAETTTRPPASSDGSSKWLAHGAETLTTSLRRLRFCDAIRYVVKLPAGSCRDPRRARTVPGRDHLRRAARTASDQGRCRPTPGHDPRRRRLDRPGRRALGRARAERIGKDDAAAHRRRSTSTPPRARSRCSASGWAGSTSAGCAPASGSSARPSPTCCAPTSPRSTSSCPPGRPRSRPGGTATAPTTATTRSTCWSAWAPRPWPTGRSARCPRASASGSCSPARSGATPASSCSTSPPPGSTSGAREDLVARLADLAADPTTPADRARHPPRRGDPAPASPTRCCCGTGGSRRPGRSTTCSPPSRCPTCSACRSTSTAGTGATRREPARRTRRPLRRGPTSPPAWRPGRQRRSGVRLRPPAPAGGLDRTISSASRRSISGPHEPAAVVEVHGRRLPPSTSSTAASSTQGEWRRPSCSTRSNRTRPGSWAVRTMRSRLDRANGPSRPRRSTDHAGPGVVGVRRGRVGPRHDVEPLGVPAEVVHPGEQLVGRCRARRGRRSRPLRRSWHPSGRHAQRRPTIRRRDRPARAPPPRARRRAGAPSPSPRPTRC